MNSIHLNRTECLIIDIIYVGQYMKSFRNNQQFNSEVNPWTNETNTQNRCTGIGPQRDIFLMNIFNFTP